MTSVYTETLEWLQHMVQLNPESKSSAASVLLRNLNRFLKMDNVKYTCFDNVFKLLGVFDFSMCPCFIKD